MSGEFSRKIPLFLSQFRTDIDLIELNLTSSAITKINVSAQCNALQTQALAKFNLLTTTLGAKSGGSVSSSVVETYSAQLTDGTALGKREKLDKYDEIVGMYNKTLLAGVVTPVIDKVMQSCSASDVVGLLNPYNRLLPIRTQTMEL